MERERIEIERCHDERENDYTGIKDLEADIYIFFLSSPPGKVTVSNVAPLSRVI